MHTVPNGFDLVQTLLLLDTRNFRAGEWLHPLRHKPGNAGAALVQTQMMDEHRGGTPELGEGRAVFTHRWETAITPRLCLHSFRFAGDLAYECGLKSAGREPLQINLAVGKKLSSHFT